MKVAALDLGSNTFLCLICQVETVSNHLTITKTFATGVSTVEHIYENERYVQCGSDPCTPKVKIYNCLGTISGDRAVACTGEETC
jgi:hypothetical protein